MTKIDKYEMLAKQIDALLMGESNKTALLANAAAAIHNEMKFFWTGFYLVDGEELVLGPFQGSVACYRIKKGRGVCGTAWQEDKTIVVPDVEQFPGHIACSSLSRSEIVVPLRGADGKVTGVLDIDSDQLATFDETDAEWLEKIVKIIENKI
ncbi:MAG: GAF domain-containing protein [Prevotella sp.]|jgi:GAF domain-containing protein|nr:GAF domain-containing protein [Prevotella sp.]